MTWDVKAGGAYNNVLSYIIPYLICHSQNVQVSFAIIHYNIERIILSASYRTLCACMARLLNFDLISDHGCTLLYTSSLVHQLLNPLSTCNQPCRNSCTLVHHLLHMGRHINKWAKLNYVVRHYDPYVHSGA